MQYQGYSSPNYYNNQGGYGGGPSNNYNQYYNIPNQGGSVYGGSQRNFNNQSQQVNYGYNNGPPQNNNYNPNQPYGNQQNFNNNGGNNGPNNYNNGPNNFYNVPPQGQQPKKDPLMMYNSLEAGPPPGQKMWSKKKKRITNPSQKYARMEIEWNIVTDYGDEEHHVLLKHIQDPDTDVTERRLYLDGELVVNETSNECKFELDIGEDEVDVVIMHNQELTRYDYFIYINEIEYADKNEPHSKQTGGMTQTLKTKDISAKELKKKNKKRWEERNQLKVKEEKDKKRKVRKKPKYKRGPTPKINKDKTKKRKKNKKDSDDQPKKEKRKWGFMGGGKKKKKDKKDKKKGKEEPQQMQPQQNQYQHQYQNQYQQPQQNNEDWNNPPGQSPDSPPWINGPPQQNNRWNNGPQQNNNGWNNQPGEIYAN